MPPSPITPPYSQDQHSRAEPLFHCLQEKSDRAQRSEGVAQRPQNSVESPSTHPRIPRQGLPPCAMRHGPGIQCRHPNDPDQSASPLHDRCTQSRAWGWSGIQSSTGDQNGRHNEGLGFLRGGVSSQSSQFGKSGADLMVPLFSLTLKTYSTLNPRALLPPSPAALT